MKTLYFDMISGASGDMILSALLDAGLPPEVLHSIPARLKLQDVQIEVGRAMKGAISATQVSIAATEEHPHRHLTDILAIVEAADLPESVREPARRIFNRLGEAEASIHNQPVESVHLHEVGGVDAMVDVVGAVMGLYTLGVQRVAASPFPLGHGMTRSMHGPIPVPAPATLALLKGAPVVQRDAAVELVTPTGAAIISTLAAHYGACPPLTLEAVGYGAGQRDQPVPNVLRVWLGDDDAAVDENGVERRRLVVLETNIDDANPQVYDYLSDRLFAAGALDVTLTPLMMKKQRPAVLLGVLTDAADAARLRAVLFREGVTLGVREMPVQRYSLPRETTPVETPYGTVRVKIARYGGAVVRAFPEYDDCRAAAEAHGVPFIEVYHACQVSETVRS
ncbi:MAG: nickel pincer cofactor biosynthesis protein LarC [Anaerolineae bacterium]|nr:nickel pincer cofactor biosynthesis protein LarC [Anaerolineae bacterium]